MEKKHQEKLKPLTAEQHAAEAAYAEDIRQRLGNPTPEMTRTIFEAIDRHKRRSKEAPLIDRKLPIKPK
jgi:hypothetical protein